MVYNMAKWCICLQVIYKSIDMLLTVIICMVEFTLNGKYKFILDRTHFQIELTPSGKAHLRYSLILTSGIKWFSIMNT